MSHDHHHDHHHSHDHDHHHGHSHSQAPLTFAQKLSTLLDHWVQHNDHHAEDYRKWAQEARENDQAAVAEQLETAAELTETISSHFRQAAEKVQTD